MNFQQLRVFVAVAERGNMTQAAGALGLSQSAASAAIRSLEAHTGRKLFDRVGRRIELSQPGARFLPEARAVLERVDAARLFLENTASTLSGSVTIAASQTIAGYWLPRRLAAFHEENPSVRLDVRIANTQGVEAQVLDGNADLGLVEGRTRSDLLRHVRVDSDELALVAARDLAASIRVPVELDALHWIVRERGSGTREVLEDLAAQTGSGLDALKVFLVLPSNEAVRQAVEAGAGATIISERVVAGALARGTLIKLPFRVPAREFSLIGHRDRNATLAQDAVKACLTAAV